jgi:hypothetical protein
MIVYAGADPPDPIAIGKQQLDANDIIPVIAPPPPPPAPPLSPPDPPPPTIRYSILVLSFLPIPKFFVEAPPNVERKGIIT